MRRELVRSDRAQRHGAPPGDEIAGFARDWPYLVIAQWISAIDKIATKPKADKGATDAQRDLRTRLGAACWDPADTARGGRAGTG